MKITKAPAFQVYANDLLSDTLTWTAQELGVYFRLLCWSWINGPIPGDLSRIARIDPEATAVWTTVEPRFVKQADGSFVSPLLEDARARTEAFREKQREKGRASAEARASRRKNVDDQPQDVNRGSTAVVTTVGSAVGTAVPTEGQPYRKTETEEGKLKKEKNSGELPLSEEPTEPARKRRPDASDLQVRIDAFAAEARTANARRERPLPEPDLEAFVGYWTQPTKDGRSFAAERERIFGMPGRLATWASRVNWNRAPVAARQQAGIIDREAPAEGGIRFVAPNAQKP